MKIPRALALKDGSNATMCTPFVPLYYQAIIMIEEVEIKKKSFES